MLTESRRKDTVVNSSYDEPKRDSVSSGILMDSVTSTSPIHRNAESMKQDQTGVDSIPLFTTLENASVSQMLIVHHARLYLEMRQERSVTK
jgi:hypothetical protein